MQIVEIENTRSNLEPIYCGLPQGSILGPLLFIVFFNDLISMNVNEIMYADDTVVFYADSDVNRIKSVLNYETKKIGLYSNQNELLLNLKTGTTKVMLFGIQKPLKLHGRDLNISYSGRNITIVKEYVYVGNKLDSNLLLNSNFEQVYKHANNRLRLLYSVRKYINTDAATKIFNMILSILTYSGPVKSTYTKTQSERLTSLNNRAKRLTKMAI